MNAIFVSVKAIKYPFELSKQTWIAWFHAHKSIKKEEFCVLPICLYWVKIASLVWQ